MPTVTERKVAETRKLIARLRTDGTLEVAEVYALDLKIGRALSRLADLAWRLSPENAVPTTSELRKEWAVARDAGIEARTRHREEAIAKLDAKILAKNRQRIF